MAHKYKCRECGCYLDPNEMPVCNECRELIRLWREQKKIVFGTPRPKADYERSVRTGA